MSERLSRILTGFAAGVMVAASIWSLLIPAMDQSEEMGKFAFIPAAAGFWGGILFLLLLDHIIPHLHRYSVSTEGPKSRLQRTTMMVLAVTLHNIPEGMAVGVVYAGYLAGNAKITVAAAMALSIGIAIQNFPEGTIYPAARIVSIAPTGSTIPESTPPAKAFDTFIPSALSGMEIIAPSGKFWIAIPSDSASAPINVICTFPVR